jgi:extracellular factor (EF) 3-hydroxypalmitic acid methyl ester biosynthesis protein
METAKKYYKSFDSQTEVSSCEKALLIRGTNKYPIYAESASKYSLFFRYLEDHTTIESNEPVYLNIPNNGKSVELGPCQIIPCSDLNGWNGRLVFLREVYEIKSLLKNSKVVKLQSALNDLPLYIERKEKIKPFFKSFVADLKYDLQVFKTLFDDLDSKYGAEPEIIRESIQRAIIDTDGQRLMNFLDDKLEELESAIAGFNRQEHQCHGYYFRKQLWDFLMCCPLMARTNVKPRGYPGDSAMMRMIYANDYQGDSTFAKILHKHAVETPAAQSVRSRIKLISNVLDKACTRHGLLTNEKFKVFSVACGPALEMANIIRTTADCKKYHFVLMDQDPLALADASESIKDIENRLGENISADLVEGLVRAVLSSRKLKRKWGQFNFIYSLGPFDYLAPPVAKAVLSKLYEILKPGGEILIGNFHKSNPSRYHMEYWGDWVFFHRNKEDFNNILQDEFRAQSRIFFEDTGSQMFLHIKKP